MLRLVSDPADASGATLVDLREPVDWDGVLDDLDDASDLAVLPAPSAPPAVPWPFGPEDVGVRWREHVHDVVQHYEDRPLTGFSDALRGISLEGGAPADGWPDTPTRLDRTRLGLSWASLARVLELPPSAIEALLDWPTVEVWAVDDEGVLGCALVSREGGLPASLCSEVWTGRRLIGHRIPQRLIRSLGFVGAGRLRGDHLWYLADTEPSRSVVEAVVAAERGDWVAASTRPAPAAIDFWNDLGFVVIDAGTLAFRGTSEEGIQLAGDLANRVRHDVKFRLKAGWRADDDTVLTLLNQPILAPPYVPEIDLQDWQDLVAWAHGSRPLASVLRPVEALCFAAASRDVDLDRVGLELLRGRLPRSADAAARAMGRRLLGALGPPECAVWAQRFDQRRGT